MLLLDKNGKPQPYSGEKPDPANFVKGRKLLKGKKATFELAVSILLFLGTSHTNHGLRKTLRALSPLSQLSTVDSQ